jgi:hypothetical protein
MSSQQAGRLAILRRTLGLVHLLGINQVDMLLLADPNERRKVIGAVGLSACSFITIVSRYAIIAAHVGPNIFGATDPNSFRHLARDMMTRVAQFYNDHRNWFPDDSHTFVLYASYQDTQTPPTQPKHFRRLSSRVTSQHLEKSEI